MITVIGIFEDADLAEEASSYLLANEFKSEDIDIHTSAASPDNSDPIGAFFNHLFDDEKQAAHFASLGRKGSIVTVHTVSTREAQEAVDAMNYYGAVEVNLDKEISENDGTRSLIVERIVDEDKRLKG